MSVGTLWLNRGAIETDPLYQREGGVWSNDRKALFIDSVINGFDIPKIYLNDLTSDQASNYDHAIIDGKQRLTTLWEFMDDEFPLGKAFVLDPDIAAKHKTFGDIPKAGDKWSQISDSWRQFIRDRHLDMVLVMNTTPEDVEEMFERLNNGEPLTAAEARNNILGDMTDLVREITDHKFFDENLKINKKRYRHRELSVKFLLLEHTELTSGNLYADLKKRHLDDLCDKNRSMTPGDKKVLTERVFAVLQTMSKVFDKKDPLLGKMATPPLYYAWTKGIVEKYGDPKIYTLMGKFLREFEVARKSNLDLPEDQQDASLTEYSRRSQQATNDKENIRWRCDFLTKEFLKAEPGVQVKDKKRAFTAEERYVIWETGNRQCAECHADLEDIDDMQADHVVQWSWGGPTTLENARCLCESCNQALKQHSE